MTALTAVVVGGSALILVQLLAVLVCWRFGAMRGRAVVEWQDCDKQERTGDVWVGLPVAEQAAIDRCDAVDVHLADQPDEVLLTHEADVDLSERNEAYTVNFMAWETQCADLNGLAEQLGERAQ